MTETTLDTAAHGWRDHPLWLFSDFRKLFAGRMISAVGDKFFSIALSWWVISQGDESSKLHLALVMAANLLPVVLFGPLIGALVDRADKKRCMLTADVARCLFVALLAALLVTGRLTLPLLYLLCFCVSAFIPLFEAAVSSSLARLTDETHIATAVATDASVIHLSGILGALSGSILMALIGVGGAFAFNSASFALSFAMVLLIRRPLPPAPTTRRYSAELREGLAFVLGNRPIFALMAAFAAFNFFGAPLLILIPMIVKFELQKGVTWIAIFEACFAIGAGAGTLALSFARTHRHVYMKIFGGLFLIGLLMTSLGLTDNGLLMCPAFVLIGGSLALVNTVALSLFQRVTPAEMKGRFFGLLNTTCCSMIPLAYIVNGLLTQLLTVDRLLLLDGILTLALSCAVLIIPRMARHLDDVQPARLPAEVSR